MPKKPPATLGIIYRMPLEDLHPHPLNPYGVRDDPAMQELVGSVKENGVLIPAIARPRKEGGYELISGHRRKYACEQLGQDTMPVMVLNLKDDDAIIRMIDSNIQRENILPSERARAYKLKMEAMKRQGQRSDLTSAPLEPKLKGSRSNEELAASSPDSRSQIQRFIRLNKLTPDLMQLVDDGRLKTTPAVELSYLTPEEQEEFLSYMEEEGCTPSLSQAQKLKAASKESVLTKDKIHGIMSARSPSVKPREPQLTIAVSKVERYFPKGFSSEQMESTILKLLENYYRKRQDYER